MIQNPVVTAGTLMASCSEIRVISLLILAGAPLCWASRWDLVLRFFGVLSWRDCNQQHRIQAQRDLTCVDN